MAQSIMSMFHTNIQESEGERNSVLEVLTVGTTVRLLTVAMKNQRRVPFHENTRDPK
jgi:hypothetical protein